MMTDTLKEYHFTDEHIEFLLNIVRDNAQYEDDEGREWMNELANQIEDQIVNHPTNDWWHSPKNNSTNSLRTTFPLL